MSARMSFWLLAFAFALGVSAYCTRPKPPAVVPEAPTFVVVQASPVATAFVFVSPQPSPSPEAILSTPRPTATATPTATSTPVPPTATETPVVPMRQRG